MVRIHGQSTDRSLPFPNDGAPFAYRDPSGTIWWFGYRGIYRYNAGSYTTLALPPSLPRPYVVQRMQATEDGSGVLWLSTGKEGLFYRKREVWHRLETAPEFAKLPPRTAFTDWMGRAWFGYDWGAIILLKDESIQRVFPAADSPVGSVTAIEGRGRHVWVGGELGLAFLDGNSFRRIAPLDAETFGPVRGVEEAPNGSVWLAERRGIIEIEAGEIQKALSVPSYRVKYRIFDSFDGLPGTFAGTTSDSNAIQGTDGRLWFLASKGIVRVDPAHISTNALPLPVLIRSVKANGRQLGSLENLTLPPRTTDLQISYTALSLSVPEKVHFRYRLEGVDKDWQDAGTRREAFYNGLGPGKYHFRVIACNNDGVWNEEGAHLDFAIAPAWYQTIWFRGFYVLAFFTLLWAGYQLRVHQLQEQEKKFREAVETMPALAFVADPKGNRTFMNRGWLEYTGLSPEEALASGWEKTIHPDDLSRIAERWRESQTTGEPLDYEARLRRRSDGVYRWFQTRARPLRDHRGKIVKWCAVANDIEDRNVPNCSRPILPMRAGAARWEKWLLPSRTNSHSPFRSLPPMPRHLCDGFSAPARSD
jgi:PAS domain S-box-containing protein